jgi:hypothetical protein
MWLIGLGTMAIGLTGCSTLVKQGVHTVLGAQGKFYEVEVVNPTVLATYESIRVEPFTNELGPRVPADVIREVNHNTPLTVDGAHLFYPEGKRLRVRGRIVHFTGRSGLVGAVGSVISGAEECVCRVELLDDASGERIGEAICWGEVKSALRRGADEFGEGVGKGVAAWVERRLPEHVVKARREELKE